MRLVLLAILCVMLPAATSVAVEQENKIVIIKGKKFFPLSGTRRHYGNAKGMPVATNKYAHEPFRSGKRVAKQPAKIVKPNEHEPDKADAIVKDVKNTPAAISAPVPPVVKAPVAPTAPIAPAVIAPAVASQPSHNQPRNPASEVLSIFEPEGQAASSPPTR